MAEILKYQHVSVSYNNQKVLKDINFSLNSGEILGIVGESGSGKSTLIRAILNLLNSNAKVTQGEILFEGQNLLNFKEQEMLRISGDKIGIVFQDSEVMMCPIRKIGSQIHETLSAHRQISVDESKKIAFDYFDKVGFENGQRIWDSYPFELSGGMNQRVGICLAMLNNPSILLADEPTSALDVSIQKQVIKELLLMRHLFQTSMIIVTHDIGVIKAMADNVLVLKDGEVMEYGDVEQVLNCPQHPYTQSLIDAVPKLRRK